MPALVEPMLVKISGNLTTVSTWYLVLPGECSVSLTATLVLFLLTKWLCGYVAVVCRYDQEAQLTYSKHQNAYSWWGGRDAQQRFVFSAWTNVPRCTYFKDCVPPFSPFFIFHRFPRADLWCLPIPTTNNTSMYMCVFPWQQVEDASSFATQVVLVSATLPHEILEMTTKFMTDPIRVLVKRWDIFSRCRHSLSVNAVPLPSPPFHFCSSPTSDELTLEGIKQFFVAVEKEEWKFDTLCDLYDTLTITQAVIFCNTKRKVCLSFSCTSSVHSSVVRLFFAHGYPGGMADREDAWGQLHCLFHAWWHAAERARCHHEGVSVGRQVRRV